MSEQAKKKQISLEDRVKMLEGRLSNLEKELDDIYEEFFGDVYGGDDEPFFVEWKNEDFNFLNTKEDGNSN